MCCRVIAWYQLFVFHHCISFLENMRLLNSLKNFGLWIKENPKKSLVGSVIVVSLTKWTNGKYNDNLFRHALCHDMRHLGAALIRSQEEPKKIIVFLNPVANGGKAQSLFEKNAAPILHLSGNAVSIVKSEYEGQAKQFMSVLDEADMIVAAGGDGTVNEVVTGLLRRPDFKKWARIPIGIIPLGKTNSICKTLSSSPCDRPAQWIMKATKDLLTCKTHPVDVLKIDSGLGKPVFAMCGLRWGSYRDTLANTSKYWVFGPLKNYMTFIFAALRSSTKTPRAMELSYDNPKLLSECQVEVTEAQQRAAVTSSILSNMLGALKGILPWISQEDDVAAETVKAADSVTMDKNHLLLYDQCGLTFKTLEFMVCANQHNLNEKRENVSAFVSIEEPDFTMKDFVVNGVNQATMGEYVFANVQETIKAGRLHFKPLDAEHTWFSIDNENYEAMPCTIDVLPNQLNVIHGESS